ncbi:helix-turn-helix domain-containing protein [Longimycelium tulufanense]|uniref:Helix-turn-helix domain-containing protein n=1 Tax=Longimycelium tulufanense TaxID=907463 RepID=A0A8J3CET5_9PSEU|nr:helix-turn-helix domain-containing protein [Longimycelium tulufanense]GGM83092.1 helix-turn-helix domain-containing protein [Longimycelium tulufanense]
MTELANDVDSLWSPERLSAHLAISPKTLAKWRGERKGPPWVKIGKHIRYDPAKVQAWLEKIEQETVDEPPLW